MVLVALIAAAAACRNGSIEPGGGGGPPDGGPIVGTDAGTPDAGFVFGTPGPWPMNDVTYGSKDGIHETPIVGMSTDEAQNLWVATPSALYLLQPGAAQFKRFTIKDGLHLAGNPALYCDVSYPDGACPIGGEANGDGIVEITAGAAGEVFVGYNGVHNWSDPNDELWQSPNRHSGQLDRVKLKADGTIQVDRLQMLSGDSALFWHNRDVMRLVYDHFHHAHELYVGTNHGITRFTPDGYHEIPPQNANHPYPEYWPILTYDWMSDHLHPQACGCGPCVGEQSLRLADWRGLAVTSDGNLLVGGRWAAGKIVWTQPNWTSDLKGWFQRGGGAYDTTKGGFSMGDPYFGGCGGSRPVWCVGQEGDAISVSAVTETPDGLQWFASGPYSYQPSNPCTVGANAGDRDWGIASYDPKHHTFVYYNGPEVGLAETNVRDMVALPDGRIVFAGPNSGLVFWNPQTHAQTVRNTRNGLPSNQIFRLELDTMVSPPTLHVATGSGAVSIRITP
jgi:hypothetical protein